MCMLAERKKNVSVDSMYTSNRKEKRMLVLIGYIHQTEKKERSECIYPSMTVFGYEYNRDEIVRGLSNRR
jgi:hypothetical protein